MRCTIAAAVIAAGLVASVSAQRTTAGDGPRFEVASVKPNSGDQTGAAGGGGGGSIGRRGQHFVAVNARLRDLIRHAFRLESYQAIEGGPRWLDDRYDITALIPDSMAGDDATRLMLHTLLAERFKLAVDWNTREQPAYALVLARRDGRLGPGMKVSPDRCDSERAPGRPEIPRGDVSPKDYDKLIWPVCDMLHQPFRARILAGARTMADFARILSRLPALGSPVVDRTGLTDAFDFELTFAPERSPAVAAPDVTALSSERGPSLFIALQEQLGLKLESSRAPVDVLVIKGVERPTPD